MNLRTLVFSVLAACAVVSAHAESEPEGPSLGTSQEPLAIQGDVVLTQAEIDAAFSRIPEEHRLAFVRDGGRVDQLIRSLLEGQILAAEARKAGYDEVPLIRERISLAAERELAEAWLQHVVAQAPEVDYEALAYEQYLANPEPWKTKGMVDVTHLLISSEDRSEEEALAQIQELRAALDDDPSRFDELVLERSEDPSVRDNKGRFPEMVRGQMVKPFEDAAFALQTPGEISQPVKTDYGYHLIRLNRRIPPTVRPYDEVREAAVKQAKSRHLTEYRSNYLRKLLTKPIELPDGAVEAMAKRYFGEDLQLAPEYPD